MVSWTGRVDQSETILRNQSKDSVTEFPQRMKIKLACGITKQLEKEFLVSNFQYFKDYFQSSIYKNEDEANLGVAQMKSSDSESFQIAPD